MASGYRHYLIQVGKLSNVTALSRIGMIERHTFAGTKSSLRNGFGFNARAQFISTGGRKAGRPGSPETTAKPVIFQDAAAIPTLRGHVSAGHFHRQS